MEKKQKQTGEQLIEDIRLDCVLGVREQRQHIADRLNRVGLGGQNAVKLER